MDPFLTEFRATLERATESLRAREASWVARELKPGGWSPSQVIGHLIDSASNNHARFVRAQFRDDLSSPGYEQSEWVRVQAYEEASWDGLLDLFSAFNLHLIHIIAHTSEDVLEKSRVEHDLERIAWETVPASEPVTLGYFVRDYFGHLCHHLRQIDPELAPEPLPQRPGKTPRGS